jgi:hypothetical protein
MAELDRRRAAVIGEAETWLLTPYHHMGRVKGGGTDCLMLLAEVYEAVGLVPHIDIPFYPRIGICIAMPNGISKVSCSTRWRSRGRRKGATWLYSSSAAASLTVQSLSCGRA